MLNLILAAIMCCIMVPWLVLVTVAGFLIQLVMLPSLCLRHFENRDRERERKKFFSDKNDYKCPPDL